MKNITKRIDWLHVSDGYLAAKSVQKKSLIESIIELGDIDTEVEASSAARDLNNEYYKKKIQNDNHALQISNVVKEGKNKVLSGIIFDIFYEALLLDDDFKAQHSHELRSMVESYIIDELGGFQKIKAIAESNTNASILRNIVSAVGKFVTEAVSKQACSSPDDILQFDISEDDQKELDYLKGDISADEISDLVRQKVLAVVKDEKERQAAEDELISDIEDDQIGRAHV